MQDVDEEKAETEMIIKFREALIRRYLKDLNPITIAS